MSGWKKPFHAGISSFRADCLDDALVHFSKAIELGGRDVALYDSRAAVYEKLDRTKDALLDSKRVIDLAPQRWQGYARSSRLFLKLQKYDAALKMVDHALERLKPDDATRRVDLTALRAEIVSSRDEAAQCQRETHIRTFNHFGKLPVEIATTIFTIAVRNNHAHVFLLAHVCRTWRATLLNTPSFWRTLVLSGIHPARKGKLWGERCQGRLAELTLRKDIGNTPWVLREISNIPLDNLRTLRLDTVSVQHLQDQLPAFTVDVLRNLHELEVISLHSAPGVQWLWAHPDLRLRRLRSIYTPTAWEKLADNVACLESLEFFGPFDIMHLVHLLWLLHRNQQLNRLVLTWWSFASPIPPALTSHRPLTSIIELPCLTELQLSSAASAPLSLMMRLSVPRLQILHLSRSSESIDSALHHLRNGNMVSSLMELHLDRCVVSADAVLGLLRSATALQIFQLSSVGSGQTSAVLEALGDDSVITDGSPNAAPSVLCPNLTHVDFSHCPDVKSGPLIRLVKMRLLAGSPAEEVIPSKENSTREVHVVAPITTLIVDGCLDVDASILPWLRSKVSNVSCVYMTKAEAKRVRLR